MNYMSKFRNACFVWLTAVLLAVTAAACEDDKTTGGDLRLHYPEVIDIGPSMSFISGAPTYYGPAPSDFSIAGMTLDDKAVASDSFTISPETGAVSISDTEGMATGTYKLTVACRANGAGYTFRDIFVVRMVPSTPVEIETSSPTLTIPYDELGTTEETVSVSTVGESVAVIGYELVQPEGQEYFSISKTGVVSLSTAFKGEVLPGVYPLPIKISTHAGSMVYEDVLTAKITSRPLGVTYTPVSGRMEYNMAFQSAVPVLKGSPEEVMWAVKGVTPSTDVFTVDAATGVLSVAEGNGLPIDGQYVVDLTVSNSYGSTDFEGAYTLTVIDYIAPIEADKFAYEPVEAIQGGEFSASKKIDFVGDEVTFSLGTLDAALVGQLSIDPETGAVSAKKGHTIPMGSYAVPVIAANAKGTAEASLSLTIKENPYFFTTITYGNNLGLTPAANYANQFYFAAAEDFTQLTPTTDAKPGTELSWSVKVKHQCAGTTIDPATGVLELSGYKSGNGGLLFVTATAGEGQVGETSVTVPVFFSFHVAVDGVTVRYKPFVMQVNPRKGGMSVVPEINGVSNMSSFLMDYRRTFNYYNIGGPDSHIDGQPSVVGSFLNQMWAVYNAQTGITKPAGTGSKDPLSYFVNKANLNLALLYVDQATKSVVVNANKWIDANGVAANGAMLGQITFVTNGNESDINGGKQIFPVWIWFDEKF